MFNRITGTHEEVSGTLSQYLFTPEMFATLPHSQQSKKFYPNVKWMWFCKQSEKHHALDRNHFKQSANAQQGIGHVPVHLPVCFLGCERKWGSRRYYRRFPQDYLLCSCYTLEERTQHIYYTFNQHTPPSAPHRQTSAQPVMWRDMGR